MYSKINIFKKIQQQYISITNYELIPSRQSSSKPPIQNMQITIVLRNPMLKNYSEKLFILLEETFQPFKKNEIKKNKKYFF